MKNGIKQIIFSLIFLTIVTSCQTYNNFIRSDKAGIWLPSDSYIVAKLNPQLSDIEPILNPIFSEMGVEYADIEYLIKRTEIAYFAQYEEGFSLVAYGKYSSSAINMIMKSQDGWRLINQLDSSVWYNSFADINICVPDSNSMFISKGKTSIPLELRANNESLDSELDFLSENDYFLKLLSVKNNWIKSESLALFSNMSINGFSMEVLDISETEYELSIILEVDSEKSRAVKSLVRIVLLGLLGSNARSAQIDEIENGIEVTGIVIEKENLSSIIDQFKKEE